MIAKLTGWDDTIVALATPPGIGALGIIRLSGARSFEIVDGLFSGKCLREQASHTLHVGYVRHAGKTIDQVVVSLYRAPHSYTGEDVIEISTHGSPYVQQQVIVACVAQGARIAKPGEFTQRAFLKGKMDLTQAEAVADIIASNTEASLQTALKNIRGGFSEVLRELREQLIGFSGLIELELDFATEDVEFADRSRLKEVLSDAYAKVEDLLRSFQLGNVIKNGVSVAIIGKPNAGKSTLLNALLNENRAIVSDIAGTTRDTIEEVLNIEGILFRLIDTAGIRESRDEIEAIGVERSRAKMREADVVVYLFDVNTEQPESLQEFEKESGDLLQKFIFVGNKVDLMGEVAAGEKFGELLSLEGDGLSSTSALDATDDGAKDLQSTRSWGFDSSVIFLSAQQGEHIDELKKQLVGKVIKGQINTESTIVTNARHFTALEKVAESLGNVRSGLELGLSSDLLALELRHALHYLGEITGEITNEDRLDFIFSKFCIGK